MKPFGYHGFVALNSRKKSRKINRTFASYSRRQGNERSIPRQFIDDLLTKSNIVDVINARVKLKKAGRDYQACCPFHHEKTPSFTVSEKKQFYYCFGCGAKGNAISFLMDYDKLEFVEAVEELAASAGLEVPYENAQINSVINRM